MESAMGVKDVVRSLLDRLPDDCSLEEVIEHLLALEAVDRGEWSEADLTPVQRQALDEELERLAREPDGGIPWREALPRIERRR